MDFDFERDPMEATDDIKYEVWSDMRGNSPSLLADASTTIRRQRLVVERKGRMVAIRAEFECHDGDAPTFTPSAHLLVVEEEDSRDPITLRPEEVQHLTENAWNGEVVG